MESRSRPLPRWRTIGGALWRALGAFANSGLFLLGGYILYAFTIGPALEGWWQSLGWDETPCTITRVNRFTEFLYTYEYAGRPYEGVRHESIQRNWRTGSERVCFVDPDSPTRSWMSADLGDYLGDLPFVVLPIGIGLAGVVYGVAIVIRAVLPERPSW